MMPQEGGPHDSDVFDSNVSCSNVELDLKMHTTQTNSVIWENFSQQTANDI